MLTLKLKAGDSLQIGDDIRLVVKEDSSKGRLTVGIDAPREINIARIPVAAKQGQEAQHVDDIGKATQDVVSVKV